MKFLRLIVVSVSLLYCSCEQLKDIRGPYQSEKLCKKRAYEIAKEMPKYRPHMEPRGYLCEEN